jgi:glycosyltransferase involved in cell wall biosynthesis
MGFHTQFGRIAELYWRSGLHRLAGPFLGWWDRSFLRYGDVVLVLNEDQARVAREAGARRVELMGTPAPAAFLSTAPPRPPDAIRRALFLGRLAPEKGISQILRAAADLPEVHVRLVGEGPMRAEVDDAAARLPNVEAVPWVDRGRVMDFIDASDLVLLPSRFETFGSAAYEGMLRRRAVLVSEGCGLTRWPRLGQGVFTMGPDEDVGASLRRLLRMPPGEITSRAERGYDGARAMSEETLDRWLGVLSDTARRRG